MILGAGDVEVFLYCLDTHRVINGDGGGVAIEGTKFISIRVSNAKTSASDCPTWPQPFYFF